MEEINCQYLSNQILTNECERHICIYKITNIITKKLYIGQTVSHVLNHKKYRPFGIHKRFKAHISEAFSNKKKQCFYLNNSIKKHGEENFIVELLECCICEKADELETFYINSLNSLYPNGYNLKNGGQSFKHDDNSKKKVSKGVEEYFKDKKFERFKNINLIDDNYEKYIHPLNRKGVQYGWYVYIQKNKADFGGVHISLEESKQNAINFILTLKNRIAKQLDAGNSLEL